LWVVPLSLVLCHGILNVTGHKAISQIFRVINEQSQSTFDEDFNFISYYNWTGGNGALSPAVPNGGNGEPKGSTGMVGTHHRPSDDISVFGEQCLFNRLSTFVYSVIDDRLLSISDAGKCDAKR